MQKKQTLQTFLLKMAFCELVCGGWIIWYLFIHSHPYCLIRKCVLIQDRYRISVEWEKPYGLMVCVY